MLQMIMMRSGTASSNLCSDLNHGHSVHLGSHLCMMHFWSLSIHAYLSMSLQAVVILLCFLRTLELNHHTSISQICAWDQLFMQLLLALISLALNASSQLGDCQAVHLSCKSTCDWGYSSVAHPSSSCFHSVQVLFCTH